MNKPGSMIDASYSSGAYFADPNRHKEDAAFKAEQFLQLFLPLARALQFQPSSYADVGCGSGEAVRLIADGLKRDGFRLARVRGYDVSPHVSGLSAPGVEFIAGDYCAGDESFDLVTLFDVFEHTPDPAGFIRRVAETCDVIGFHIPLDHSLNVALRDLFRAKLRHPGHLIFLDAAGALNLLAFAGLRVLDYRYTFAFLAPSGRATRASRLLLPIRRLLARLSPWLLAKTLGGASLLAIALTPRAGFRIGAIGSPAREDAGAPRHVERTRPL